MVGRVLVENMYGDDYQYANSRLGGTAVRHEGLLFHVEEVLPSMTADGWYLGSGNPAKVAVDDLDLQPLPLGYVNYYDTASYVTRIPRRDDWRQGTRRRVLQCIDGVDTQQMSVAKLQHAVDNIYPSFNDALRLVRACTRVAWCRVFCVDDDGNIYHKGKMRRVGEVVDGKPALLDNYVYLQEVLEETL